MKLFKKLIPVLLSAVIMSGAALGVSLTAFADESVANNTVSLSIGENIVSNYVIDCASYRQHGGVTLSYTYNGGMDKSYVLTTKTVDLATQGDTYAFSVYQAAPQIAEPTTVTVLTADGATLETFTFSAKSYCDEFINMSSEELSSYPKGERVKEVCRSIVAYGKAAQELFSDYMQLDGTVPISESYEGLGISDGITYTPQSSYVKTSSENITFSSVTFICDSMARMRFYLAVNDGYDINGNAPEISLPEGAVFAPHYNAESPYIDINNIKPAYFDERINIAYPDGAELSMSVLDYAKLVIESNKASSQMKNVARALIDYNNTSKVYFHHNAHYLSYVSPVSPTCTDTGSAGYYVCEDCEKLFTDENGTTETTPEAVTIAALGHDLGEWTVTTAAAAATCTEAGATAIETRTCRRCDYSETRGGEAVAALGHTAGEAVLENSVAATCTETGSYDAVTYCTVCGAELSREVTTVAALGHNYESVVTAPACTEGGYTTYTCTRCGDSYTGDETSALGHTWVAGAAVAPTHSADGYTPYTCSVCGATKQEDVIPALNIKVKLENTESYLYRAGNGNTISLGTLFEIEDENKNSIDSSKVTVTFENVANSASGTFTANTSDWTAATVKFANTGVIRVTVKQAGYTSAVLLLEVVAGTNLFEGGTFGGATSNNVVLLGNVNSPVSKTINNGKTLYGNGFSITDTRSSTASTSGYINMNGGGTIDNAVLLGQVYSSAVTSGNTNEEYAPGIWITGNANIYNSYVSECKYAVQIDSGTVNLENSTFDGGAIANVYIGGGNVTFKNCITSTSTRGGLSGLGVRAATSSCKINIEGTFLQYNWLKKADLPSTYSSLLSSVYSDSSYAYTYNGNTYVNMGIFFMTDSGSITSSQAQAAVIDSTANTYGYIEKTAMGYTGTIYTAKASMGSPAMLTTPAYSPTTNGQYYVIPAYSFDFTNKNYQAKTTDSNEYCYYDSTTGKVLISFETGDSKVWDTSVLTVTKNGQSLSSTVTMNGTDYTNNSITFTDAGDYTVTYTYTDPYNYSADGSAFSHTYTKTVEINVTTVDPEVTGYPASFTYDGAAGNYSAKQVIGTDNKTYVMPDVSATSSTIGSTTAGGQTVYYPIVTVGPTSSNGNTAYSSGKGYYFAPVFSEIHIIDYNQDSGAKTYEYSKSTTTWPRGNSASTGPNTSYFGYAYDEKTWNSYCPYARSMNSQYYKYGSNNLGVCYTSNDIEKDNTACNHLVQYHYVSLDGNTYYYYVYYKFSAMTYSSCVTEGTLVTMADGTQKAIEDVEQGDMVMTWSMWNGRYEAQPVAIKWYHGTDEWEVLTLKFSDGTEVRTINEHGFFDADLNTYAYIRMDNVETYIGDKFIKQSGGENAKVTLTDYEITTETVGSYSLQTAYNENFIVENMLSMTGEDYRGRFEYFDIGDGMRYDEEKMQADIERYGLYTYEDWSDYLTPEQFEMFNGAYFRVLVGKGVFTEEDIYRIIGVNL